MCAEYAEHTCARTRTPALIAVDEIVTPCYGACIRDGAHEPGRLSTATNLDAGVTDTNANLLRGVDDANLTFDALVAEPRDALVSDGTGQNSRTDVDVRASAAVTARFAFGQAEVFKDGFDSAAAIR
jgi:hypothetical protein